MSVHVPNQRALLRIAVAAVAIGCAFVPVIALGQEPPPVACNGLPGCGEGPENVFQTSIIPAVIDFLFKLAAAGSILGIIWGGVLMLLSGGDDSKVTSGRRSIYFALGGLGLALSANALVGFFVTEDWGAGAGGDVLFAGLLPAVVRITLTLFNIAAVLIILVAGFRMAISQGKGDEFKRGAKAIMWAAIGAIIVNVAKAIVEAFLNRTIQW